MQTITTKYLGPTNTQGTRIKANHTGEAKSVTVPYNYALSNEGELPSEELFKHAVQYGSYGKNAF